LKSKDGEAVAKQKMRKREEDSTGRRTRTVLAEEIFFCEENEIWSGSDRGDEGCGIGCGTERQGCEISGEELREEKLGDPWFHQIEDQAKSKEWQVVSQRMEDQLEREVLRRVVHPDVRRP
jgi:hypothetical protein